MVCAANGIQQQLKSVLTSASKHGLGQQWSGGQRRPGMGTYRGEGGCMVSAAVGPLPCRRE